MYSMFCAAGIKIVIVLYAFSDNVLTDTSENESDAFITHQLLFRFIYLISLTWSL